jgi:hypothetical protein
MCGSLSVGIFGRVPSSSSLMVITCTRGNVLLLTGQAIAGSRPAYSPNRPVSAPPTLHAAGQG